MQNVGLGWDLAGAFGKALVPARQTALSRERWGRLLDSTGRVLVGTRPLTPLHVVYGTGQTYI